MITRRDVVIARLASCLTLGAVVLAQTNTKVMESSVFDWNDIEVKPSKVGSTRKFFQAPTLDSRREMELARNAQGEIAK